MRGDQCVQGTPGDGSNSGHGEPKPITADKEGLVTLNVGGREFLALLDTLLSEDSRLSQMLQTRVNCTQDYQGVVHIAYDADRFDIVMHYLHTGNAQFDRYSVDEILHEARFWRLTGLEVLCESLSDVVPLPQEEQPHCSYMFQQANVAAVELNSSEKAQKASTSYEKSHEQAANSTDYDRRPKLGAHQASTSVQTNHTPTANLVDYAYLQQFGLGSIADQLMVEVSPQEQTTLMNNAAPLDADTVFDGRGNSIDALDASNCATRKEKRQEQTFVVRSIGGIIAAPGYERPTHATLEHLAPLPPPNKDDSAQQQCNEEGAVLQQHNEGDYAGCESMGRTSQRFSNGRGSNRWRGSCNVSWRSGNNSWRNSGTHVGSQRGRGSGGRGGFHPRDGGGSNTAVDSTRVEPSLQLDQDGFPL